MRERQRERGNVCVLCMHFGLLTKGNVINGKGSVHKCVGQ